MKYRNYDVNYMELSNKEIKEHTNAIEHLLKVNIENMVIR